MCARHLIHMVTLFVIERKFLLISLYAMRCLALPCLASFCIFSASFRLFSINENLVIISTLQMYVCECECVCVHACFFAVTQLFHDNIPHISFNYTFFRSSDSIYAYYVCICAYSLSLSVDRIESGCCRVFSLSLSSVAFLSSMYLRVQ